MFKFPKDSALREKWIAAIPRKDWKLSEHHRVCAKHFSSNDFHSVSTDKRVKRQASGKTQQLQRLRLKPGVIPHIFPGLPKYLSTAPIPYRGESSTMAGRLENENKKIEEENSLFLMKDEIKDFCALKNELTQLTLPSGCNTVVEEKKISFYFVENDVEPDTTATAPKLLASVVVFENLTVAAFSSSMNIPKKSYQHLLQNNCVKTFSGLRNLLAHCKSLSDESTSSSMSYIDMAVSALQSFILVQTKNGDTIANVALLTFIIEQLQLYFKPKEGRRYSATLITMAFLWQLTTTSLYKKLRNIFILPSLSLLRSYCSGLSVQSGHLDVSYLKQRLNDLTDQQRTVTLLIDEVYTAKRIEYNNGAFVGITEEGTVAKTVLTFMIQSSCSKYRDVVCLIPVDKLDTNLLHFWFNKVMSALNDLVFVVVVSVDNHVCNR